MLIRPMILQTAAPAAGFSTWNPADAYTNWSLANNNTRATSNGNGGIVRGSKASAAGWRHFEIKIISINSRAVVMLATAAVPLDGTNQATIPNTIYWRNDGILYLNGNNSSSNYPWVVGNTLGIDYNQTTGEFVGSVNNAVKFSGVFAAGTVEYPGLAEFAPNAMSADLNTGGSAFTSNPNNYAAWG